MIQLLSVAAVAALCLTLAACGGSKKPTDSGPVAGSIITVDLPGGAKMEFVWIEPGTFVMGSPSYEVGRDDDEGPRHQVTISKGFYLGKYEITPGQWQAATGAALWTGSVSWDEVQDFVFTLNQAAGESLYRLPTEAEWEYACRAGTATPWSFGDAESQLGNYAWYVDNACVSLDAGLSLALPHLVGTKLPNPWGLYDMHGNQMEWCQDWYGDYASDAQTDPHGPAEGSYRVARGGDSGNDAQGTRSARRACFSPGSRDFLPYLRSEFSCLSLNSIGARLARVR